MGPGFKFRMELAAQKPGMIGNLNYLHQIGIRDTCPLLSCRFSPALRERHY